MNWVDVMYAAMMYSYSYSLLDTYSYQALFIFSMQWMGVLYSQAPCMHAGTHHGDYN